MRVQIGAVRIPARLGEVRGRRRHARLTDCSLAGIRRQREAGEPNPFAQTGSDHVPLIAMWDGQDIGEGPSMERNDMPAKITVAVGGVVVKGQEVLLVRRSAAGREGEWQIPGGFVDPGESLVASVRREILEETGVDGTVIGLLAVLNRVLETENNTYMIFLLSSEQTSTAPDGHEVDAARFFSLGQLSTLPRLQSLSELLARYALSSPAVVFPAYRHPRIPIEAAVLCVGGTAGSHFDSLSHLLWYESRLPP